MADSSQSMNWRRLAAVVIAAVLGAAAGGVAVSLLPAGQFAWSGLALAPLFILLEATLKHVVAWFDDDPNTARMWLAAAILVGFYAAWYWVRSA